jgi:hypothetical protein
LGWWEGRECKAPPRFVRGGYDARCANTIWRRASICCIWGLRYRLLILKDANRITLISLRDLVSSVLRIGKLTFNQVLELGSSGVDTSQQGRNDDDGNAELSNTLVISPDTRNIEAKGRQISDSDLAAIRSRTEVVTSPDSTDRAQNSSDPDSSPTPASHTSLSQNLAPRILIDRKCSGYFVEPVRLSQHPATVRSMLFLST